MVVIPGKNHFLMIRVVLLFLFVQILPSCLLALLRYLCNMTKFILKIDFREYFPGAIDKYLVE